MTYAKKVKVNDAILKHASQAGLSLEALAELQHDLLSPTTPTANPNDPFEYFTFEQLIALPKKKWLVEDIFAIGDLCVLYGPSGCGKTLVAIDMMMRFCTGKCWAYRFKPVRQINVMYCTGEGLGGLGQRFKIAAAHYRIDNLSNLVNIKPVPQLFIDDSPNSTHSFIHSCRQRQQRNEMQSIDLLIIDTFHCATRGADENSSTDIGKIVESCLLIAKELNCAIMLIHHSNKYDTGMRGSSSIYNSCDLIMKVSKPDKRKNNFILDCVKNKDGDEWTPQNFSLVDMIGHESVHVLWEEIGKNADEAGKTDDEYKNEIVQILSEFPTDKLAGKAIAARVELDYNKTNKLLNALVKEKRIFSCLNDATKKKSPTNPWIFFFNENYPK